MQSSPYFKLEQLLKVYVNNDGHRLDIVELNERLLSLSSEQILEIVVQTRSGDLVSAVYKAACKGQTEVVSSILNSVTQAARDELVSLQTKSGNTALHKAAWAGDVETLKLMLELVSPEEIFELVGMRNKRDNTAAHISAFRGTTEVMMSLLNVLLSSERVSVLSAPGEAKYTAVHWATLAGNTETLKSIMDVLPSSNRVQLLDIRNASNRTPRMLAQYLNKQDTVEFLKRCREAAESNIYGAEVEWIRRLRELNNEVAQLREYNAHLTRQVDDQELHIADVEDRLGVLRQENSLLVNEITNQRRQITQLTNGVEERNRHISDVEKKGQEALMQERQLRVKETANQSRRITQLTNENEEHARRISELEVQLARKDVELQAFNEEVALQDDKVNRVIDKVITNTEDIEQMQVEQKTTTEAVTRCEHKVASLEKEVDYLGLTSVGGDDTLPSENRSYETTEAIEEGQLPVAIAAIQIDE